MSPLIRLTIGLGEGSMHTVYQSMSSPAGRGEVVGVVHAGN
ncbi:hypothetical protein [Gordonia insulae]|uniref:Uncharacterized protein n=1 Tax=Gordonia insulae TaxID=2420509 RepID=A0A3G8JJT6_9ACTN|nr:hypothetical protein [Gordonia insulae]AZG45198.1 hypothetical protein D7316_01792 [Gordonia insulae]